MNELIKQKFKVNLHSLVAESKYLRQQENKFNHKPVIRQSLHSHRVNDVREELRITNIAYGFCKGLEYNKIEPKTNKPLTPEQVYKIWKKISRKGLDLDRKEVKMWLASSAIAD